MSMMRGPASSRGGRCSGGLLIALFLWTGCGNLTGPDLDELRTAPFEATVEGTSLQLRSTIARTFSLPVLVSAHAFLVQPDSLPVPESVRVDGLWVVRGENVWRPAEITEEEEHSVECPHERWVRAHADGSEVDLEEWEWGDQAFAVVRLASGNEDGFLLRSPDTEILSANSGPLPLTCGGGISG